MTKFHFPKIRVFGKYNLPKHPIGLRRISFLPRKFDLLLLLTLLAFSFDAKAQNDTPCECSQRWTAGAAWNPNGTVNENPPPMSQPVGIVKCGSTESIQANIMTQFGCTYNPAAFPINLVTCTDPITGIPIPAPAAPNPGEPIIFFNFDLRPNVGTVQIQINENNMLDNIGWALYYSATPTTGTGPGPHYQSGDCNNLVFYHCGTASGNNWVTIFTPFFTEATNWYLVVWDQDDDIDVMLENFKGRYGCGDGDLYCDLETGTVATTCNINGTYTVNIPIAGQNGNYIGTDPNALNSPSAGLCLTNTGDGGPTSGIISLTYNYGTPYDIDISIDINGPCPDPILPGACTANIVGIAPDCCIIPPDCTISGPTLVCPLENGILYTGQPNMDSYLWTITGNGSIVGASNGQSVSVTSDAVCSGGYELTLQVVKFTCVNTCMLQVTVDDDILPSVSCPAPITINACPTQMSINDSFNSWVSDFSASDNCGSLNITGLAGATAPSGCGGTTVVNYSAMDNCGNSANCSSTFTILAPATVVLTCPANVTEAACQSQQVIQQKYTAWLATAMSTGGCNAVLSHNSSGIPSACGESRTVIFTVNSSCQAPVTCSATFTVTAAPAAVINCPTNITEAACQTQASIDTKYANWLATVSASGGCNGALTNNSTGPPSACGGSKTVIFTYTSTCAPLVTSCSATFTVTAPANVVLTCPTNQVEAACQTQGAINAKYNTWLATVVVSGGCNGALTNNSTTPPDACGGSRTVTFTYTSTCAPFTTTCQATFTVNSSPAVLTCPANTTTAACLTQAAVNTAYANWLASVSISGGCNGMLTNNSTGPPDACGGSKTVMFTYTSTCAPLTSTCSATFTVPNAPVIVLNCPPTIIEAACQTQAAINTKYNNWLNMANFSGGCNGVLTNNSAGIPSACGGVSTVTFTVAQSCGTMVTCTRSFTVSSNPVQLTCPAPVTEAACQTQAQINSKFSAWLATVSTSGGCNPVLSNNNSGAPPACGGSTTVTFTVISGCEAPKICSATFAVANAPVVTLTCPVSQSEVACQTQGAINTKYANWLATVSASGGCNGVLTNNSTGAPDVCTGGTVSVTFTYTSNCPPVTSNCTATFTVAAPPPIVLNCPANQTEAACQTQAAINAKYNTWLASVSGSGGCTGTFTNNSTGAPNVCTGGVSTVTFNYISSCAPFFTYCTATFTVTPPAPVVLTCPSNVTEAACQSQATIDSKFATWLASVSASGGCNGMLSNNNTGAPNVCTGGTTTVTFTYTSTCAPLTTSCTATFTVNAPAMVSLTCPANVSEPACQTQAAINGKFATWLASASAAGGCNGLVTNNNTGAPNSCGGTTTVTFTYTSSCAPLTSTCAATFTVEAPIGVVLTCPGNQNEGPCQTQAAIDMKYNTWLASVSASNGCSGLVTNNSTGAPSACGGSKMVTFTYSSPCSALMTTCQATFSVEAAPTVTITCAANTTVPACQTQAAVDDAYAIWLGTASANGGCNSALSNNSTGAPLACGGSKTVIFTYTSSCAPLTTTCSATFTVTASPAVALNCPVNTTVPACQTQAAVNDAYAIWLATASASGGCNGSLSNNSTGAPPACGGSKTVVFTYTSSCAPLTTTCSATFTVTTSPAVALNCPVNTTVPACQTQAVIDDAYAIWLATASASGGCNGSLSNNSTGAPLACGGSKTVIFTYTSSCAPLTTTCSATFTVTAAPAVVLTCPVSVTETTCQSQTEIDNKYAAWLASATISGGCNAVLTNNNPGSPSACGGSSTVTFTVMSSCEGPVTCSSTFAVTPAPPVVLNCPAPFMMPPLSTQAQIDAAFATWLATANSTGGCGVLTNDNTGAPSSCGGSTTVTFTFTSSCAPIATTTCSSTFSVPMVAPGIGVAKYFAGIQTSTSGIPGNFDVITEIVVQNLGSTSLSNLSLVDNLGAANNLGSAFVGITGAPQIVAVGAKGATTTADVNPTINPAFNGNGNNNLLLSSGMLMPGQRYVLQFRFEVNPDAPGAPVVMKNQATASGSVSTCSAPMVVSDLSDEGDNPMTSNAGYIGDSGGSNDPTLLTNCWSLLNSSISCNDLVQVSLNQNCEIWLTPGMVLEGEAQMCINPNLYPLGSYYEVLMVTDANGAPVPDLNPATANIYEISGSYIGQYLTVKIRDKVYKNTCWGQIFIEDKLAPVFNCPSTPVTVFCSANLANVPPPTVTDNCDPNPIVSLVGQQIIDNDICGDGIYTVRRTYKATDNHGNMSANCVQNINLTRPPVDFPDDITWSCTQYSAHPNIVNATTLHPTIVDVDPVEQGIDVSPSLPDTTLAHTGSGVVNVSLSTICKYSVLKSDQTVGICGASFKIIRTWTVLDWCTGDIITTGVGGEDNVQVIKIADKVAPTITRAPFNVSINVPAAYPQPCKSTGILLPPTIADNCNAVTVQIITTIGEAIYLNGVDGKNGGTIPAPGLGIGINQVTYIATDACGNSTTIIVPVTVLDDVTPTAVCVSFTEVDLPSGANPTATVLANVFNTGSTDNCCLNHFEVRRMEDPCNDGHDDTVFGTTVKFCCEDVANSPVMVVFRAFDCFGNFNDCMVQVNVNDKQPPVLLTCPANQRITCDFYADNFETQLAALGSNQTAKSQLLDAMFGQPTFADNCTSITVSRTFASSFTQCKEGTMTRTWKATDAQGQESFPCSQTVFVDHVSDFVVNFPADITVNCGQSLPNFGQPTVFYETCEMVAINHEDGLFETVPGACYKFIRTWTVINWCTQGAIADQEVTEVPESLLSLPFPQCDLDGDGDCDIRTFRDSWTATQKPTANQANQQFGPDTDPDSDPWDGYITYKQTIMVIDNVNPVFTNCSIPDVCIQDTAVCAATFTLPQPTVMDCSSQVTITANTPGLGAGFGPFTHGPGTFITTFTASDGCNNTSICRDTFEVKDCKAPNIYCAPLIAVLMPGVPPMVPVNAQQLDAGTTDNCSDVIQVSFTPNVSDSVRIFLCEDEGVNDVQIWFTDEFGNQDFCVTTVTIQDNTTSCNDDTLTVHLGGQIFNENDVPVSGVTVSLNGTNTPVSTGATGSFYFPSVTVGQDVTLVPSKDDNPLAGVTTYDIVKMSKHILNIELLDSPYKMIAADVNNSKTITTFDLVELRKLILHINSNFPSNTSWRFVERAYNFPVPTNPWFENFPEIISINDLPAEVLDADFVAVKIGDVNVSYSFAGDENEDRSSGTLIFATQNQAVEAGQTCSLSFRAKDFETVGYQFTLDFDTDKLEFVEVGDGEATDGSFGFAKLEEGAITASWNEHGKRSEGMADFTLVFKAKKRLKPSDAIGLSDRYTRTEAYSKDGDLLDIRLQFTDDESVGDFELFQNRPNPFSRETVIGFRLPEAGKAQLTITDATGKLVKTQESTFEKGYNEFRLNRDELGVGTGILYYRLAAGAETATKMMILTE